MSTKIRIGSNFKVPSRAGLRFGGRKAHVKDISPAAVRVTLLGAYGLRKNVAFSRASLEAAGFVIAE
jgi:hypothetical protein